MPSLAAAHAWLLDLSSAALVSGLSSLTPAPFLTGGIAAVTAPLRAPAAAAVSTAPAISFTALTTPGEPRLAVLLLLVSGLRRATEAADFLRVDFRAELFALLFAREAFAAEAFEREAFRREVFARDGFDFPRAFLAGWFSVLLVDEFRVPSAVSFKHRAHP